MASRNLRAPEVDLSSSRQQFIQSLENKKLFEQECAVIIPELDRLWEEKILAFLGLTSVDVHRCGDGCDDGGCEYRPGEKRWVGFVANSDTYVINWKHYLFIYTPQLLSKAITRLSSRLKFDPVAKTVENARGEVKNVSAYYKSVVQDMRRKELRCAAATPAQSGDTPIRTRVTSSDFRVGEITPWGYVTKVGNTGAGTATFMRDGKRSAVRGWDGVIRAVECPKCYEEEHSYSCIRPAHKSRQADVSMETVAADMMEESRRKGQ